MSLTAGVLVVALAAAPAVARGQAPCDEAFQDTLARATLRAFDAVAAVPPVWDDYTLARHPLLLLADSSFRGHGDTPVCAAIWRAGVPLDRIELPARPPLATPLYGMIDSDPIGAHAIEAVRDLAVVRRAAPAGVIRALKERGVTRAVVLQVPMDFTTMGPLGAMLRQAQADPARLQADLAVHESFHLHSQFPTWMDQPRTYAWPAWDLQPDRAEMRERCYAGSPALTAALDTELRALLAAFDAVLSPTAAPDTAAAIVEARRFMALRDARRTLQDTMTVPQGTARISCALAEDLMELEEGATQWLGHATTVRAGLTTIALLRGSYAGTQPERFYQSGPLQLWVLEALRGPDVVRALTAALARSPVPRGVFAVFEEQIGRGPAGAP